MLVRFVKLFARVMMYLMGTSGAETLSVSANVFMGQTEAPLIVKPFVPKMTQSELLALMASGMAHISGGMMAVYISYGADPVSILCTCVMACPCSLYLTKLVLPETETPESLSEVAAQISVTERRAMKAERETADRLIAHHLADRIGATFQGRISGVTRAGLFVKLSETGADGLIPIRTLGTEYFNYDETRHALVGSRSGAMHRLGDVVDVRLVEAAPVAGALRFELLSEGKVIPRGRKQGGRREVSKAPVAASKAHPGRSPPPRDRKSGKAKSGQGTPGKPKKGKSWKR